jgi:hypothetical protein
LIGVAIDAASGSGVKHPDSVLHVLTPKRFNTVTERDEWFVRQEVRVNAK